MILNDQSFAGLEGDLETVQRTDDIIYMLISNNVATLKEIRDDYSIEEVLDLYEIVVVKLYNKNKVIEASNESIREKNRI